MHAGFAAWLLFARAFRRASLAQDHAGAGLRMHQRLDRLGAGFVVVFALTITAAAWDWLAALDPSWSSTMFAVYVFAGSFVQGIAAITLATVLLLRRSAALRSVVGQAQLHDLGKLLFAFSIFWTYIWVCQYLLIWYGNIPEEVGHFITRTNGRWLPLFVANVLINFVVPFLGLLSVPAKTDPRRLAVISGTVLVGRWLDLYLVIMPAVGPEPRFGLLEILLAAVYGALLVFLFRFHVARAPLVPQNDPVLAADAAAGHPVARRDAA